MEQELAHSFNIVLDTEIFQRLKMLQEKLMSTINERRTYDPLPHLSIATKFMSAAQTDAFVTALIREFQNDTVWELKFTHFSPSETGNFIFLHLDDQSRQKVFDLHHRAFEATKHIGYEGHDGLPPQYPYDPHISIIKLETEERAAALKLMNEDFSDVATTVQSYEIVRQKDDENGFATFPKLGEINLK